MEYFIKRKSIPSQFIELTLQIQCREGERILLQLPAWRPGRYELANYAQKIRDFSVIKATTPLEWKKTSKDLWEFEAAEPGIYTVTYAYYCNQMDAGGCWSDDTQLYLNFSNCCFEVKGRENEEIRIHIDIPRNYTVATALPVQGSLVWVAEGFQHLMDSPWVAAENLTHLCYRVEGTDFHLWLAGEVHFDREYLVDVFRKFTQRQIEDFGSFPAKDYHFIFQLLPYTHYHGVEHSFSTVITFGPASSLVEKSQIDELFGVSSHELYHFWNVCRIRPKELQPYDLSKEAYLDTGLVMEGVTTYFGDMYLLRSGYFSRDEYLEILTTQIQKEFESFGWKNQSIVESSFDLWLDGYKPGIPHKKVSIYNRGALISLCLDLLLLDCGSNLATVMRQMWEKFGETQKGYTMADFEDLILLAANGEKEIGDFLKHVVHGKEDLFPYLETQLQRIGISIRKAINPNYLAAGFGIKIGAENDIVAIHPESQAYQFLMLGDIVQPVEALEHQTKNPGKNIGTNLKINRRGRNLQVELGPSNVDFFPIFKLEAIDKTEKQGRWMLARAQVG